MKIISHCTMPMCHDLVVKGGRLCQKHAGAGNDLRVPQYVLDIGLDNVYNAMVKRNDLFSVEDIIRDVDSGFDTCSDDDKINRTNAMAKLFRTLRANNYITKRGHYNGFVCYSKNAWEIGVSVSVDEEIATPTVIQKPEVVPVAVNMQQRIEGARQNISTLMSVFEKEKYLKLQQDFDQMVARVAALESLQKSVDLLWQKAKQLDETTLKIMHEIDTLKGGEDACPVAKMRAGMHHMLGGKKSG